MPFYDPIRIGASGAADTAFTVGRSLRFNDDDGAYLEETAGTPTNNKIWTYSVWVKRTTLSGDQAILVGYSNGGSFDQILFSSSGGRDNQIFMQFNNNGTYGQFTSTRFFRDAGAWGHLVIKADTTAGSNGVTVYWNNEVVAGTWNVTLAQDATFHSLNQSGDKFRIGHLDSGVANHYLDGYLAEVNFVDGQALNPSSFAETNATSGQWVPKDTSGLNFGTNGFRLQFADNSNTTATTLGKDTSGNSNNFTLSNFVTGDAVKDSPTNNFATLNVLSKSSGVTTQEGNLYAQGSSGWRTVVGNFHMSSGKWYWEIHIKQVGNSIYGILPATRANGRQDFPADVYTGSYSDEWGYSAGGTLYNSASGTSSWGSTYTAGDILGFALDMDNGTLDIKKNGSTTGSQITGISTTKEYRAAFTYYTSGTQSNINFGQDSTFAGQKTAQGNTDGSGQGDFYYAPPSGYKALCSANLPDPTILLPNKHFDTLLYTGNGGTQSITGLNYQPDWVWIKKRDSGGSTNHHAFDSVRGVHKHIPPNTSSSETTDTNSLTSFNSDGFSLGNYNLGNLNAKSIVAWNWNAGDTDSKTYTVTVVDDSGNKYRFDGFGTSAVTLDLAEGGTYIFNYPSAHPFRFSETADGTHGGGSEYTTGVTVISSTSIQIVVAASAPNLNYYCSSHSGMGGAINTNTTLGSSNFDGSVQSICKVNATAGMSITRYTGTGGNITVGHGLGVTPEVNLTKSLTATSNWTFLHTVYDGSYDRLYLNSGGAYANSSITAPTSTVFSRTSTDANNEGMICYSFSSVKGYSKIGYYVGNGSADGTFVFCGFRPAWIMIKGRTGSRHWVVKDNKRNTFNVANASLLPNSNTSEDTSSSFDIDILSNGFKCRTSGTHVNGNNIVYIFMAFAESPFKNARAR